MNAGIKVLEISKPRISSFVSHVAARVVEQYNDISFFWTS